MIMSGCAVYMASTSEGEPPKQIQKNISYCSTRKCILLYDPKIVQTDWDADGHLTEYYLFDIDNGQISRAVMHGLLDIATLGLWEIAGMQIEREKKEEK